MLTKSVIRTRTATLLADQASMSNTALAMSETTIMNLHGKYLTAVNLSLCLLIAGTVSACGGGGDDNLMTTPLTLDPSSLNRTGGASPLVASDTAEASDSAAMAAAALTAKEFTRESDAASAREQAPPNAAEDPPSSQTDLSALPPTSAGPLPMGKVKATTSALSVNVSVASTAAGAPQATATLLSRSTWTRIAVENEPFTLTQRRMVRYGSGTAWTYKLVTGSAQCSTAYFRADPVHGAVKECAVQDVPTIPILATRASAIPGPVRATTFDPAPVVGACSTTPVVTTSDVTKLSVAVGRASGVAPLAVFFDTTGTVSNTTDRPFHEIEYHWNFGETSGPGIGQWGQGSRPGRNSRNAAIGPVAGHVFETPGTYVITVNDAAKTVSYQCSVTVQDPEVVFSGKNTSCFSTSGNFSGCPIGANQVNTSDFSVVRNAATPTNTVRRLLMRRGETWTASNVTAFSASGPGLVGAFGTGVAPVIVPGAAFPETTPLIGLSGRSTPTMKDWRFMDITLDASSKPTGKISAFEAFGGIDQLTLLRVTTNVVTMSVEMSEYVLDGNNASLNTSLRGHHEWDQLAIVDMNVLNMPPILDGNGASYGVYLGAERLFFAGNFIDGNGTAARGVSHNARFTYLAKAAVSNNTFLRPGPTEHCIKLHSKEWGDTGVAGTQGIGAGYTRWVHIADNKCVPAYGAWPIAIGYPSSDPTEFRGKDIILERNLQTTSIGRGGQFQSLWWSDITSRNNIFDMSKWDVEKVGIYIGKRGATHTPPDRIKIYNNTFYSSRVDDSFIGVQVDSTATNVTVKNNLAYAPYGKRATMIQGTGALSSPVISSNNSTDLRIDPLFATVLPEVGEYKLTSGSYAVRSGITSPVFSDFYGTIKAADTAPNIGATGY